MTFRVVSTRSCRTNEGQQCLPFQCQAEAPFLDRFCINNEGTNFFLDYDVFSTRPNVTEV